MKKMRSIQKCLISLGLTVTMLLSTPTLFATTTPKLDTPIDTAKLQESYDSISMSNIYDGMIHCVADGKTGYLNIQGEVVIPPQYDEGYGFYKGCAIVVKDDLYGLIDKTGKPLAPIKYTNISLFYDDGDISTASFTLNGLKGTLDSSGKEILPAKYASSEQVEDFYWWCYVLQEGRIWFQKNDQVGYADANGKEVIPAQFSFGGAFKNGLACVCIGEQYTDSAKWGFIDKTGKQVIPCQYEDTTWYFNEDVVAVQKDGKWGYIDKTGKVVIPFDYDSAYNFSDGLAWVQKGDTQYFINHSGKKVKEIASTISPAGEYGVCIIDSYSSTHGTLQNGMIAVRVETAPADDTHPFGYNNGNVLNKNGQLILKNKYDEVELDESGLIRVVKFSADQSTDYIGYCNAAGKEIIPCKYSWSDIGSYFSEGYIKIKQNGKWGFMDTTGKLVVPCIYDSVSDVSEGYGLTIMQLDEDSWSVGYIKMDK